jgi:hypothetical protein
MPVKIRLACATTGLLLSLLTYACFVKFFGTAELSDTQLALLVICVSLAQSLSTHVFDIVYAMQSYRAAARRLGRAADMFAANSPLPIPYEDLQQSISCVVLARRDRRASVTSSLAEQCLRDLQSLQVTAIAFSDVFPARRTEIAERLKTLIAEK